MAFPLAFEQRFRYHVANMGRRTPSVKAAITPAQCRMARAALELGVRDLATAAKVSTNTITRFEGGEALRGRTVAAIRAALEAAGIAFIAENGGGLGVRLKRAPRPEGRLTR